jgi:hypothetical protein
VVPRGGHPSSEGVPNRPDGRRPDSSPKGITVAGQCRIRTGLRSCVLLREGTAESPETRISSKRHINPPKVTSLASERSPGRAKRGRCPTQWLAAERSEVVASPVPDTADSSSLCREYTPLMRIRLTRLLGAAILIAIGVLALRRAGSAETPVAPGSWEPAE